jgi:Domain of unknown function (DUF4157)
MESTRRSRRHRNPQAQEPQQAEQQQPFFSKSALGSSIQAKQEAAFFQPKLTIGKADDPYEKEADAVADKVVSAPAPKGSFGTVQRMATPDEKEMPATNDARMAEDKRIQEKPLQREPMKEEEKPVQKAGKEEEEPLQAKADNKEEEKPVQKADKKEEEKPVQKMDKKEEEKPVQKVDKEEEKPVQKADKKEEEKPVQKMDKKEEEQPVQKADKKEEEKPVQKADKKKEDEPTPKGKGTSVKEPFETRLAKIKDKGKPLPDKVRAKMEAEMQHDFSSVSIHDDATAAELAEEIHAQAFAKGNDIYFNVDKYNPETPAGTHLLAHELTHVIQQGAAPTKAKQK